MPGKNISLSLIHIYHSVLELGWCISGSGECYAEDQIFPFCSGDVQIIFPYQKHYNRSQLGTPSRWYFINLDISTPVSYTHLFLFRFFLLGKRNFYPAHPKLQFQLFLPVGSPHRKR